MTKEQFKSEVDYQLALLLVRNMVAQGLLSDEEFKAVQEALIDRHQPLIGKLFP